MKKELLVGLHSLVSLQFFALFSEYFFSVSTLYVLLAVIVITYNIYGLILQKALSESLAFVLLMTSYLIFNDDLLVLNFLNFNNSIINDQFAFFTRILICVFSAFYFLIIASCLKEQKIISFEYPLIILLAVLGLLLMCNSNDFLITYLAIELATLAFYILASFQKTSNCSVDTAVKYFIIGAVSSAFFLLGSSFIYGFTGSINFYDFSVLFGHKFDWTYENFGETNHEDPIFFIDHQLVTSICGPTILPQFDGAITDKRCYPGFISEFGERPAMHIIGEFHPLIDEVVKSYNISAAVNCFYYYPLFGFYNGLIDIFFLQDYWNVVHQFGSVYPKSLYLSECEGWAVLDFLREKHCDSLIEESVFLSITFQKHLSTVFSFRPLLSVMFVLLNTNNGEINGEIIDYFLRKYHFNFKESICFDKDFFDNSFIEFGLILILFSLFIKLASAPFHIWSLDFYEGVPISSAFFFAVLTKLSIFVLLIRLCYYCFLTLKSCWQFYSLAVGLFSIFVGSFGGLKEKRLKTLLAYSSISHMGYALIAFSTSTFIGIQMLLLYVFIYMLSGLSIWYVVILLVLKKPRVENKYSKELSDLALLRKSNLMLAISLSLSAFSVAGIPPLVGFFAKLNVFLAVVGDFFYLVGFLSILCSVVSTFYYIRIVKVLYFENLLVGKLYYPIKTIKTVMLGVLTFLLLFFFVDPTILYLVNYKSVLSLL